MLPLRPLFLIQIVARFSSRLSRYRALLYSALGAFEDFETAMYFSGVTFTSLGYGDVVLDGRMRLLGPLQAANGLMMFGITTALFIAAVQQATAKWTAARRTRVQDAG